MLQTQCGSDARCRHQDARHKSSLRPTTWPLLGATSPRPLRRMPLGPAARLQVWLRRRSKPQAPQRAGRFLLGPPSPPQDERRLPSHLCVEQRRRFESPSRLQATQRPRSWPLSHLRVVPRPSSGPPRPPQEVQCPPSVPPIPPLEVLHLPSRHRQRRLSANPYPGWIPPSGLWRGPIPSPGSFPLQAPHRSCWDRWGPPRG
mmetsp:Transcript_49154/g.137679  ORF Transcript_49154/g.137679 Transcript_49154/m.137679 type:complete len:202 (-) Transcript_49154:2158-2763(-)